MFEASYQRACRELRRRLPRLYDLLFPRRRVIKYVISGGAAAAVNIGTLYAATDFFHVWYIFSEVIAFILSFFVSMGLQKFWTFRDHSRDTIHIQLALYFGTAMANLVLNTILLYAFVEFLHVWYLIAQIIIGILLAIGSFFVYKIIFKKN